MVDILDAGGAIHADQLALGGVVGDELDGFAEEKVEAVRDLVKGVVGALLQRAAVVIADAGHAGGMRLDVPDVAVGLADVAPIEALHELLARNLQIDDGVQVAAVLAKRLIQRACLGDGAGKAIQNDALGIAEILQAFEDQRHHDLVGHEVATVVVGLGRLAEQRAVGDGVAQQLAAGAWLEVELFFEELRLCAFAAALGADQDDVHGPYPPRVPRRPNPVPRPSRPRRCGRHSSRFSLTMFAVSRPRRLGRVAHACDVAERRDRDGTPQTLPENAARVSR